MPVHALILGHDAEAMLDRGGIDEAIRRVAGEGRRECHRRGRDGRGGGDAPHAICQARQPGPHRDGVVIRPCSTSHASSNHVMLATASSSAASTASEARMLRRSGSASSHRRACVSRSSVVTRAPMARRSRRGLPRPHRCVTAPACRPRRACAPLAGTRRAMTRPCRVISTLSPALHFVEQREQLGLRQRGGHLSDHIVTIVVIATAGNGVFMGCPWCALPVGIRLLAASRALIVRSATPQAGSSAAVRPGRPR